MVKNNDLNRDTLAQKIVDDMSEGDLMSYAKDNLEKHFKENDDEFQEEWLNYHE